MKAAPGVAGVMEHSVGDDDIGCRWTEGGLEEILLNEHDVGDVVSLAECVTETQRAHAEIGAEHDATPTEPKEVAELSRAAPDLENRRRGADLLVQEARKDAVLRLVPQGLGRVDAVVVRERSFFVEGPDNIRDVLALSGLRGPVKPGKAALTREAMRASRTRNAFPSNATSRSP